MNRHHDTLNLADLNPELVELVDEISEQFARGEEPELDAICRKYPHVETELRRLFPAIAALASLGVSIPKEGSSREATSDTIPQTLGDFRIVRELGRGGMGIVYEAEQISLDRRVALKVLPLAGALDERQLARFKNESKAAASLRHPNIVGVYAIGVDRGVHYYAMELIEGRSLALMIDILRTDHRLIECFACEGSVSRESAGADPDTVRNSLSSTTTAKKASKTPRGYFERVAQIGIEAAEALAYAHERGLLHRDMKPANLLLDDRSHVFVTDFGLARVQSDAGLTMTGDLIGTLRYMSPEQASGETVLDQRTDIYSLGLVLYELATLRPAFDQSDRRRLLSDIMEGQPAAPSRMNASIPRDLETIILKAVARRREARFATAQELADDLRRFLEHKPIHARRPSRFDVVRSWVGRHPAGAMLAMLIATITLVSAVGGPLAAVHWRNLTHQTQQQNLVLTLSAAMQAWEDGDVARTESLLAPLIPTDGSTEGLSFPVRHLWGRCQQLRRADVVFDDRDTCSIAYSPDGKRFASVTHEGTMSIWDVESQSCLMSSHSGPKRASIVVYSPQGEFLVTATRDGVISVWDPNRLEQIGETSEITKTISDVSFSHDGRQMATSCYDGKVRLYEVSRGRPAFSPSSVIGEHKGYVTDVAFTPDGRFLLSSGHDREVQIWDLENRSLATALTVDVEETVIHSIDVSPNGSLLAIGSSSGVTVVSTALWQNIQHFDLRRDISQVAFSRDGQLLAASSQTELLVFDTETLRLIEASPAHRTPIVQLEFSPVDDTLMSCSSESARFWSCQAWHVPPENRVTSIGSSVGFLGASADSPIVVARGDLDEDLKRWNGDLSIVHVSSGHVHRKREHGPTIFPVVVHPNIRTTFAICCNSQDSGWLEICDTQANTTKQLSGFRQRAMSVAFSPDGTSIAAIDADLFERKGELIVYDLASQAQRRCIANGAYDVAFSVDGKQLAVACGFWGEGGRVDLFDVSTLNRLDSLPNGTRGTAVAYSPDGELLATADVDGHVAVWDLGSRQQRFSTQTPNQYVLDLEFTRDSKCLAVAGANPAIDLWDVSSGVLLGSLSTASSPTSLKFSDDGNLLVAGCLNGSVCAWYADGRRDAVQFQWPGED